MRNIPSGNLVVTGHSGRSVLLIEGRDRVGGRSYTIEHNGNDSHSVERPI
jgi:monoamine oxidase